MSDELRVHMKDGAHVWEALCLAGRQRIEQADVQVLDTSVPVNAMSRCTLYEAWRNQSVAPVWSSFAKLPVPTLCMSGKVRHIPIRERRPRTADLSLHVNDGIRTSDADRQSRPFGLSSAAKMPAPVTAIRASSLIRLGRVSSAGSFTQDARGGVASLARE